MQAHPFSSCNVHRVSRSCHIADSSGRLFDIGSHVCCNEIRRWVLKMNPDSLAREGMNNDDDALWSLGIRSRLVIAFDNLSVFFLLILSTF